MKVNMIEDQSKTQNQKEFFRERINYGHHCLKQDISNICRKERFVLSIC